MTVKYAINGVKVRESRSNRIYTHAVVKRKEDGSLTVFHCSGSLELAQKAIAQRKNNPNLCIVPLEVIS